MTTLALRNVPLLRPDQGRIALALREHEIVVAAMGRRWGKTILGLCLVLGHLLQGMRVAWVVPTYRNSNPLWRAVRQALGPLVKVGRCRLNQAERNAELWNGGFLAVFSGDSADAIRGEWFHLVIIDEAARIDEATFADVISPTVADVGGRIVLISTPMGRNWFWRMWQAGNARENGVISFTAPSSANPNPRIQRAAELAKSRVPDRTYQQEWMAQFVPGAGTGWLREWTEGNRYDPTDEVLARSVVARWLSYDTAAMDKKDSAYSVGVVAELLPDYRVILRHVWRDRVLFPELLGAVERHVVDWDRDGKLHGVIIESASSGISLYQTLMSSGSDKLRRALMAYRPTAAKAIRFEQAGVWAMNGSFMLPEPSAAVPWLHAYEAEIFEDGEYLDQRDATAQLILRLETRVFHVRQERLRAVAKGAA